MGVLVVGGNGFIGKKLVGSLADDYDISITQRNNEKVPGNAVRAFETGELSEFNDWDFVLHGITKVIHLASCAHKSASSMRRIEEANYAALQNLLLACRRNRVRKFIYFSTAYVHGKTSNALINENSPVAIESDYELLRLKAENLVTCFCQKSKMDHIILRPSLILSSDAPGSIKFLSDMIMRVRWFPFKGCSNKRSYLSVEKLLNFVRVCLDTEKANSNVYLLSNNETKSLSQVLDFLAHEKKVKIWHFSIPIVLLRLILRAFAQRERESVLFDNFIVDSSKADKLLDNQHLR